MPIRYPIDLGAAGYVSIRARIGEGALAFTCLADVNYEGKLRRAYLKVYDLSAQPMAVVNEVLGYLFAQAMQVPAPAAFFVEVPSDALLPFGWLGPAGHLIRAVGTLEAHDPSVATDGTAKTMVLSGAMTLPQLRERLLKAPAGQALVAFDEAVGNPDRNIGNIVLSWKHGVVAIDHGCILTGPTWTTSTLNSATRVRNVVLDVLQTTPLSDGEKNGLQAAAETLNASYYSSMAELQGVIGHRTSTIGTAAFDFVWWRTLNLRSTMAGLLGVLP